MYFEKMNNSNKKVQVKKQACVVTSFIFKHPKGFPLVTFKGLGWGAGPRERALLKM